MAETPRTQVEEPRFGVSIQPAADPVDRTIIARAPSITPDPYMNAWAEIARDFASAYGGIKKAQVEADIPMGEQYYLEAGVDGLFDAAKPDLAAIQKAYKTAEENSVGTRIGFERAAGRSAANREKSKITSALDALISGSRGLDANGMPILVTTKEIEETVAKIRGESYGQFRNNPEYAWFYNSPYAAEEYNKATRNFVPEITEGYKQKARELIAENNRGMAAEQAAELVVSQINSINADRSAGVPEADIDKKIDALNVQLGEFINDNVILGNIREPKKFMAETFKSAGLALMNNNPSADSVALMDRFIERVNKYNFNGANMQSLYWSKASQDLRDEASSRDKQRLNDRVLQVRKAAEADRANFKNPESLSAQLITISKENTDPVARITEFLRARDAWVETAIRSGDPTKVAFAVDVAKEITEPFLSAAQFGVQGSDVEDKRNTDIAMNALMRSDYETATLFSSRVTDPEKRLTLSERINRYQSSKAPEMLKSAPVLPAMTEFGARKTFKPTGPGTPQMPGTAAISIRPSIMNKDFSFSVSVLHDEMKADIMEQAAELQMTPNLTQIERQNKLRDYIKSRTEDLDKVTRERSGQMAALESSIRENEKTFRSSVPVINKAFEDGIIDAASRDRLISSDTSLLEPIFPTAAAARRDVEQEFLAQGLVNNEIQPRFAKYIEMRQVVTNEGVVSRPFITVDGQRAINDLSNSLLEQWVDAYTNNNPDLENKYKIKIERNPDVLRLPSSKQITSKSFRAVVKAAVTETQ